MTNEAVVRIWKHGAAITADNVVGSWVEHPSRYWNPLKFHCCRCGKRRLFARLYDVHPLNDGKPFGHFAMVCADCLIEVIDYVFDVWWTAGWEHANAKKLSPS